MPMIGYMWVATTVGRSTSIPHQRPRPERVSEGTTRSYRDWTAMAISYLSPVSVVSTTTFLRELVGDTNGNVYAAGYFYGTSQFGGHSLTSAGGTDGYFAN